jgi:fucose permease
LSAHRQSRFERDRATWTLYLLTGYFAYLESVLGPIIPFLRAEHRLSHATAGLHFGAFALGGIVVALWGHRIDRRVARERTIWAGGAGMGLGAILVVVGANIRETIAGASVMGVFGALLLMSVQATLADQHPRVRAVVLLESNVAASSFAIIAPAAVGLAERLGVGWRGAPLLAVAVFIALAASFRGKTLGESRPHELLQSRKLTVPLGFWAIALVLFLGVGVEWSIAYWAPDFLAEVGFRPSVAATSLSSFFAALLCGRVLGSRLARFVDDLHLLTGAPALALVGFLVFWLGEGLFARVAGLFVSGLGIANLYPIAVAAGARLVYPYTAVATARLSVTAGLGILIAPLALGGLADDFGIVRAYSIVIPLLVATTLLAHGARRLETQTRTNP